MRNFGVNEYLETLPLLGIGLVNRLYPHSVDKRVTGSADTYGGVESKDLEPKTSNQDTSLISDWLKAFIIVLIILFCTFGLVGEIRADLNDIMMMELMLF